MLLLNGSHVLSGFIHYMNHEVNLVICPCLDLLSSILNEIQPGDTVSVALLSMEGQ